MLTAVRLPGAARAFVPSLIGRLALAMATLALVLAVQETTGSFSAAGLAAGSFGVANVVAAPLRARALDRWGQARALVPLAAATGVADAALAVASRCGAGVGAFVVLSVLAGVSSPPVGAAMRAVWSSTTAPGQQRTAALSLDATADEVVFIAGPLAAAALVGTVSAAAALLAAAVAATAGTLGLVTSGASRAVAASRSGAHRRAGTLRQTGFARVLVVCAGVGVVLGAVEVVAPAAALAHHDVTASGWLVAALSAGSALGGVVFGHVAWRSSLGARMLLCAGALGALVCGCAVVEAGTGSLVVLAAGFAVVGVCVAPTVVLGYLAAEQLVPGHAATEASVWTTTALNVGAAASTTAAGVLVNRSGTAAALLLAGLLALAAAVQTPRRCLSNRSTLPR